MPIRPRSGRRNYSPQRGQIKRLHPTLSIGRRDMSPAGSRFFACLHFKTGGWSPGAHSKLRGCADGRNPRQAVARVLHKAASSFAKRSGAFAGFAGYSKKNRRVRRTRRAGKRKG